MNQDENNPDLQTHIEPELEARIVAAVLGEASAFEMAELERLIGEKPELAIFKRRIEAVHGLTGAAMRPEQAPLRLAPERRAKILAAIGATPARLATAETNAPVLLALATTRRKRRRKWIWAGGLAASVMFAAVVTVRLATTKSTYEEAAMKYKKRAEETEPAERRANREQVLEQQAYVKSNDAVFLAPFEIKTDATLEGWLRKALTPSPSAPARNVGGAAGRGGGGGGRGTQLAEKGPQSGVSGGSFGELRDNISLGIDERQRSRTAAVDAFGAAKKTEGSLSYASAPAAVTLSPFTVNESKDLGYFAGNTLAGSRTTTELDSLKSKTLDFSGKITVVTKQQLSDASALDINDFFLTAGQGKEVGRIIPAASATQLAPAAALVDQRLSQEKVAAKLKPQPPAEVAQGEVSTAKEPVSTFSLHVSDVSFRLAQAALARGETPDPSRIRPEEFYNAFDYGDPSPTTADKISSRIEQAAHPFLQQRNLVRIAMKVASSGRGAGQPLHLTILLDTSGSMEREDRVASVHRALETLATLLGANDRVTLIGFAREPRLLAENLPGNEAGKLAELASQTPYTGGTNLEEALKLSGELARRHRDSAAQNRIVLITDGAANLGNADPAQLATMVETLRQQNIALDACGVGTDGLDDSILEALTRKGDGRYYVINQPEDADAGFARKLAGAFRPAAENVKVQVRFNPARVGSYRLIGFEQHRLREEDFRNDQVDAAELAADEAAVALYQVEVLPEGEGELGDVFVRFRDPATGNMVERSWTMLHEPRAKAFDRATATMQLAGTAALLAEKLRGGEMASAINLDELVPTVNALRGSYANDARVRELIVMFDQMRRRTGK